jgi:hypothetical protein
MKDLTRARLMQAWFGALVLIVVGAIAFGASMTVGTAVLLLAMGFAPALILLMLWPTPQPATVTEVLYGDRNR